VLLAVLDGSVQVPAVRRRLRLGWGLCPRHAWLLAATEIELRGGAPFTTAVLYEDLLRRAARVLGRRVATGRWRVSSLHPRAGCIACEGTVRSAAQGPVADPETALVNKRARTSAALHATATVWRRRSCPRCLGGTGPPCRLHFLSGPEPPGGARQVTGALDQLAGQLRQYRRTAWDPSGGERASAWVEALGWFAGWWFPARWFGAGGGADG